MLLVEMQDHLDVVAVLNRWPAFVRLARRPGLWDLAVADEDQRLVLVRYRLPATCNVDDAEAAMSERDVRIPIVTFAVGAAMR